MQCPYCKHETNEKKCPRCSADLTEFMTEKEVKKAEAAGDKSDVPITKNKYEK